MCKKWFYLFVFLFTFFCLEKKQLIAQSSYQWGVQFHAGKILKHTPKLFTNPPIHSGLLTITFLKKTNGWKLWQQNFARPVVGYQLVWQPRSNTKVFGHWIAAAPSIQFGLGKKQNSHFLASVGFGYASKRWQRIPYEDSINNYLGTHINFFVQLGYQKKIWQNNKLACQAGVAFNHISNGGIRKPNFGINQASLFVAFQQKKQEMANQQSTQKVDFAKKEFKNKWGAAVKIGASFAEYGPADGPLLPIGVLAVQANYTLQKKHKLMAGVEAEMNGKTDFFVRYSRQQSTSIWKDASYYSAFVGNEFLLGKLSIYTQAGMYLNNPFLKSTDWYSKFGLLYYPFQKAEQYGKGFYTGLLLKANGLTADYPELCVGYGW
jgi:hypothetical protein